MDENCRLGRMGTGGYSFFLHSVMFNCELETRHVLEVVFMVG